MYKTLLFVVLCLYCSDIIYLFSQEQFYFICILCVCTDYVHTQPTSGVARGGGRQGGIMPRELFTKGKQNHF